MGGNLRDIIDDVFPRMLEELAFMFADCDDGAGEFGMPHDAVLVHIAFSGEREGSVDMGVGRTLGLEMAANLLGVAQDANNAEQLGDDALLELMNVTCGHILSSMAGDKPVFNLTIPEISQMSGEAWDEMQRDVSTARFTVDGRPVQMRVCLNERGTEQ